ncbi:MAG: hypothetical protein ABSB70_06040 [Candidatus Velthaea sp.]
MSAMKALSVAAVFALVTTSLCGPGLAQSTSNGDLSHLTYSAREGLMAKAISPDDGGIVNAPATSFEVATVAGAGVELAVNAKVIPPSRLGRRAEQTDGTVRYTYYGVVLAPGENIVVLTPLGADGLRGPSVTERVWGPGAPAVIHGAACSAPRADGRTPCAVRIAVLDRWGHPAAPGATLKATIAAGDATFAPAGISGGTIVVSTDATASTDAANLRSVAVTLAAGSTATIPVVPGVNPGRIRIDADVAALSTRVVLDVMAYARRPIVTGLATVGVGAVPGDPATDPTAPDGTNSRLGRVALFGTGALSGNAVGTIGYDTAGSLAPTTSTGTLNADPNDRPYATYGDASIRRNDALTQDRLYARVDDGHANAMWGEFEATTGPQGAAGAVAMQVDGARISGGSAALSATAFSASNQVGYGRELINPSGLATLNLLDHDNLVVGSETVTLASIDRHTGIVLRQTILQNTIDYTIDYTSGIIRFIDIPLPYDAQFNPQQVLVTYEYSALGGDAKTTGARLDAPLGNFDDLRLGLGYLNDSTGSANFALLNENVAGRLPGGSWSVSHAASTGTVPGIGAGTLTGVGDGGGDALRFAGATAGGPYKFSFGYDATTAGYGNPFGDLATPGLTDYHVALVRALGGQNGDLSLAYDRENYAATASVDETSMRSNLIATLHEKLNARLAVHAGLALHGSETTAAAVPGSAGAANADAQASVMQAVLGADWKATKNLSLSAERDQNVGGFDATQPAQTTAQASWDLGGRGRIYARELWTDSPLSLANSTGNLAAVGSATHATEFGIEQKVNANTSVDSEYLVSGTGNGTDVNAAIGVRERLVLSQQLKGDAFVQRGVAYGSDTSGFAVYGLSLGYGDAFGRLKATGSLQDRTGDGGGATWSLGAAGKLVGDVSLLGAYDGSRALGNATTDARVALAWRPSLSDRGALLAGYQRASGNADVAGAQSGVLSLDGVYRPAERLELTGRYAYKTDGDSNYAVGTALIGVGARQRIGPRLDVGIETREVLARAAGGGLHSTAVEVGALPGNTLRAALGYNFGTTADSTLAAAPTRKGVYVTLTTTIDRIFGWGAEH